MRIITMSMVRLCILLAATIGGAAVAQAPDDGARQQALTSYFRSVQTPKPCKR
jgi:hypothetical protein